MTAFTGTLGCIGGGKMAEAILAAVIRTKTAPPGAITVSDVDAARRRHLEQSLGVAITGANADVMAAAQVVILAVKPQQLDAVLPELAPWVTSSHLLLSIAAGKRLATYATNLPGARVVRVMPNIAALAGLSANAYCLGDACLPDDAGTVSSLLSSFGEPLRLDEAMFDAVTALSGSGPAFLAYVIDAMAKAGAALGLNEADAQRLAYRTALGTASLLDEQRFTPESLIAAVSSAKGTTVAGMAVLRECGIDEAFQRTLAAAAARSRELSG